MLDSATGTFVARFMSENKASLSNRLLCPGYGYTAQALAATLDRAERARLPVEALDRARLLSDITRALSDNAVNILHASVSTAKDRTAFSKFTFEMADASHLEAVLASVKAVPGVYDVYRVKNN